MILAYEYALIQEGLQLVFSSSLAPHWYLWTRKKQPSCLGPPHWFLFLMRYLQVPNPSPVVVYCNDKSGLYISVNPVHCSPRQDPSTVCYICCLSYPRTK